MTKNAELTHLFRAMKAPAAARALPNLAERARQEEWSYERFAEALLSTEISSRESSGGRLRIRAARFPAHKTLEEFNFHLSALGEEAGDRAPRTIGLLARQAERDPARAPGDRQDPTFRSPWESARASLASEFCSALRPNGSPSSPMRNAKASSTRSSTDWTGSRCSVDLCRYRDYADIVVAVGLNAVRCLGFPAVAPAGLSA